MGGGRGAGGRCCARIGIGIGDPCASSSWVDRLAGVGPRTSSLARGFALAGRRAWLGKKDAALGCDELLGLGGMENEPRRGTSPPLARLWPALILGGNRSVVGWLCSSWLVAQAWGGRKVLAASVVAEAPFTFRSRMCTNYNKYLYEPLPQSVCTYSWSRLSVWLTPRLKRFSALIRCWQYKYSFPGGGLVLIFLVVLEIGSPSKHRKKKQATYAI